MKKRVFINATKFLNVGSSESLWKDSGQSKFVIELDENLVDPASQTDYLVFTKILESKSNDSVKYYFEGYEIENSQFEILGSQEDYLTAVSELN